MDPLKDTAYIEQRVERDRQADAAEAVTPHCKEPAWLARGARGPFDQTEVPCEGRELIADVPDARKHLQLKQMAVSPAAFDLRMYQRIPEQ